MKLLGKKNILGLDIGTGSIKVVQLKVLGERIVLVNFAYQEIPYSERSKGSPDDFIINLIKKMSREANLTERKVFTALSGSEVNISSLTLPKMPRKDLEGMIKLEIKRTLSFDLETAFTDFYIKEELPDNKLGIMAVAASGELVKAKIKMIEASGFSPAGMDIPGYALENLIRLNKDIKNDEVVVLIDLGAKLTIINIFKGKKLQFTREITTAGDNITAVLVRNFVTKERKVNLDFAKAEELKKEVGIPEELEKEFSGIPGSQISALIRPVLDRLTNEIKRSLGYFRQAFNVTEINRVFLSGGSSKLKGLDKFLAQGLGIKTEHFDPLKNIKIEYLTIPQKGVLEKAGTELALALGLALEKRPKINLLPSEFKIREKLDTARTFFVLGFSLIFFLLLLFSGNLMLKKKQCLNLLVRNKFSLSSLEPALKELKEFETLQSKVNQRKALLKKAIPGQPFFPGILKEVSALLPGDMVLTALILLPNLEPEQMRIEGKVFAPYTTMNLSLSKFLVALEKSPFFERVRLISIRKKEGVSKPEAFFELTLQLVY